MRAPEAPDCEPYAQLRMSERAKGLGGPISRAEAFAKFAELLDHWKLRGFGRWIVADKRTDQPLGLVGLMHSDDWPEPEIAWAVFENGEGKGIAYEAALATRNYAYNSLGWKRVISLIMPDNVRSIALARRLGAVFEDYFQHESLGQMEIWRHLSPEELA